MNGIRKNRIEEVLEKLFSFRVKKRRENTDDLREFLAILEIEFPNTRIIHIAGTNGKGSAASYIENILIEAGYSVGKFTSPHILKYNERIVFNRNMIEDDEIVENYELIMEAAEKVNNAGKIAGQTEKRYFNFFEITFFIALLYFCKGKPDFIILETGLGGRMDATNTLNSDIAVITNVSFDHTDILGDTLQKIAYEKAGIIKNGQLCIYSQNLKELEDEIRKKTDRSVNVLNKYSNLEISLDKENFKTAVNFGGKHFIVPLFGKFQAHNFLLAFEVAKIYNIDDKTVQRGLDSVRWSARFEMFRKNPAIILDAAHNDDSTRKLAENLKELYRKEEVIIITSLLETKDIKAVFQELNKISEKIFVTSLKEIPSGQTSSEIREKMSRLNISDENAVFEDDILEAYRKAEKLVNEKKYRVIVVCGSFFEISKFKKVMSEQENLSQGR